MLDKKLIDELKAMKAKTKEIYVCHFSDGHVETASRGTGERIKEANTTEPIDDIKYTLKDSTRSYIDTFEFDFDKIEMDLYLGLVYNISAINENGSIKEDAKPYDGVVRFYTGSINSYLNGEQTNDADYNRYGTYNYQGFVNYDNLVKAMKNSGLKFVGPEDFDEFKNRIENNEKFGVKVVASLTGEDELEEPVELEKPIEVEKQVEPEKPTVCKILKKLRLKK